MVYEIQRFDAPALINSALKKDAVSALFDATEGLFNFRQSLFTEYPRSAVEIKGAELAIEDIIPFLADQYGIDAVADELWKRGVVTTPKDIFCVHDIIFQYDEKTRLQNVSDSKKFVGIVGGSSTGKGTIGEKLQNDYGFLHFPLSNRLREFCVAKGGFYPQTREQLREIDGQLKPRFGKQVFVEWTWAKAQRLMVQHNSFCVSFDGFRSVGESSWFKERGGYLIGIKVDEEIRYQRQLERARAGDDFSWEKFNESNAIERKWIDPIYPLCHVIIENNGTIAELQAHLENALERVLSAKNNYF